MGYWVFRNSFTKPSSPTESDVVLYYFHGGAYSLYQPGHFLPFLLRVAEELTQHGLAVSIFALDYALAPEAPFPAQLEQAAHGYRYLVGELGIRTDRLALLGDSAGANLGLSLASAGFARPAAGLGWIPGCGVCRCVASERPRFAPAESPSSASRSARMPSSPTR